MAVSRKFKDLIKYEGINFEEGLPFPYVKYEFRNWIIEFGDGKGNFKVCECFKNSIENHIKQIKDEHNKLYGKERFDDKLAACYTILTHLELKYGGSYIWEIANILDEYLSPERDNTTYGDNSAFPGLYPPLNSFMFYLNKNDKDLYDSIKRTCTRIDKKNRKKQNLKTYGFIAFIIIAFILLFNLI